LPGRARIEDNDRMPCELAWVPHFLVWYAVFVAALAAHEAAHGLVALWGGDDSAYGRGLVTLNPWPHLHREPLGTFAVPLVTFLIAHFPVGWTSTPRNGLWCRHHPWRQAAAVAAGPGANLLLASIAFLALKALLVAGVFTAPTQSRPEAMALVMPSADFRGEVWAEPLAALLSVTLSLNLVLCAFHLLPVPPLDGSRLLMDLFPGTAGALLERRWARIGLAVAVIAAAWLFLPLLKAQGLALLLELLHPGRVMG
jgi:Zn-dependent protease